MGELQQSSLSLLSTNLSESTVVTSAFGESDITKLMERSLNFINLAFIILGTIGNIFTFFILMRKNVFKHSCMSKCTTMSLFTYMYQYLTSLFNRLFSIADYSGHLFLVHLEFHVCIPDIQRKEDWTRGSTRMSSLLFLLLLRSSMFIVDHMLHWHGPYRHHCT